MLLSKTFLYAVIIFCSREDLDVVNKSSLIRTIATPQFYCTAGRSECKLKLIVRILIEVYELI